jgi:hypothetical protein
MDIQEDDCILFTKINVSYFLENMKIFDEKEKINFEFENFFVISCDDKGLECDNEFYKITKNPPRITFTINKKIFKEQILYFYLTEYNATEINMFILKETPTLLQFSYYDNKNYPKKINMAIKMKNIVIFY